ncbi:MAG: epoxide hydrolase family protein [Halioglobus sp.]
MSDTIRPFTVDIPDDELDQLRQRIAQTRWPEKETVDNWDQGAPLSFVRPLAQYWQEQYDWRRCEALLNSWPQFKTTIDGLDIHFLHCRSPHPNAMPLLITHGWPGSILEFRHVIADLLDPTLKGGSPDDAFHIIAPSLPGFAFSDKPSATGTGIERIGEMWATLMQRLGYSHYGSQGGDWGSAVSQTVAMADPEHCIGVHINMVVAAPDSLENLTPMEERALLGAQHYARWDSAYANQQATRPQTLSYGLADSPVGQMAWILEKFQSWTDSEKNGEKNPLNILSKDELLDNVMLYWLTNSAASSARIYWESFNDTHLEPLETPIGCSIFPTDIFMASRRWAEVRLKNIVYWSELTEGGHFAALEKPELFINEVRACFREIR